MANGWVAPEENMLKIKYVDRAFTENGAVTGLVVRNHWGQLEAAMVERISGALNTEHVECPTFLKALKFARDFGITHFILEGDA